MNNTVELFLEAAKSKYRNIYYLTKGGNAGDSLIHAGFYSLATKTGLTYTEINIEFDFSNLSEDDLLIMPGGGYIVPQWSVGRNIISKVLDYKFPLLLLPQSISGNEDLLLKLRKKDVIFAREEYTREYLNSLAIDPLVLLDHDMAFSIDMSLLREGSAFPLPTSLKTLARTGMLAYHFSRSRLVRSVNAFRTDGESARVIPTTLINDLSLVAKLGNRNRAENISTAYWFLKLLSTYELVRTDRLHAIIGCILSGTMTEAHPNNYYKVRGVYEYSIKAYPDRARLVKWAS